MIIFYDAGMFIAADRNDRAIWAEHRARLEIGLIPKTTAPIVAQVSRSSRQVMLRRFLRGCEVIPFDYKEAHEVGALLNNSNTADVVDAHLALLAAHSHATVFTSDPNDIAHLANTMTAQVHIQKI
jgi:predicted nucleic acid-binding protein